MKEIYVTPKLKCVDREVGIGDIVEATVKILITDEFTQKGGHLKYKLCVYTDDYRTEFTDDFICDNVKNVVETYKEVL